MSQTGGSIRAALIIPALNEAAIIGETLARVPEGIFATIVVADNGSTDNTGEIARGAGAHVTVEPQRGYGATCLTALASLTHDVEAVVFMQADGSEQPIEARRLLAPIEEGRADLVIGSRVLGNAEPGALLTHQRFGNWLATRLIRLFWGHRYTDLGPYRAIRMDALRRLRMCDRRYGWTVEMQVRALCQGLRVVEVPVSYSRRRAGVNKVSGSILASLHAGAAILWTVISIRLGR